MFTIFLRCFSLDVYVKRRFLQEENTPTPKKGKLLAEECFSSNEVKYFLKNLLNTTLAFFLIKMKIPLLK